MVSVLASGRIYSGSIPSEQDLHGGSEYKCGGNCREDGAEPKLRPEHRQELGGFATPEFPYSVLRKHRGTKKVSPK